SLALTASGATNAKLRMSFDFNERTATPANLRRSEAENFLLLPPPSNNRRLVFTPLGLCSNVVSNDLPVISPLAMTSAAACCTFLSATLTKISVLSFSPRSKTTATRHSVSTSAEGEKERVVFISFVFIQYRRRSANCARSDQESKCLSK